MFNTLNNFLSDVKTLCLNTSSYKTGKLKEVSSLIKKILEKNNKLSEILEDLTKLCQSLLHDREFAYVRFGFFGMRVSRSERIIKKLFLYLLSEDRVFIFIEALEQYSKVNDSKESEPELIRRTFKERRYNDSLKSLTNLIDIENVDDSFLQDIYEFLHSYFNKLESLKIMPLENQKQYYKKKDPSLEKRVNQKVYTLIQIKDFMDLEKNQGVISFTYIIDLDGNVIFSLGATNSYHCNINGGNPVFGAGEVYLENVNGECFLKKVNNKSGLYLPEDGFLKPLKEWFGTHDFSTQEAIVEDERQSLIRGEIEYRLLLR